MGCSSSVEARNGTEGPIKPNSPPSDTTAQDEEARMELDGVVVDENGNTHNIYERDEKRPENDNALWEVEEAGEGDQFMAVKPWIGALKAPSNPPKFVAEPPTTGLELEYVYGYRAIDSRQNLFYTNNPSKVVYMTAALGVVLDKTKNTQQFFGGGDTKSASAHNDDITALAISPDRTMVATGQVGKTPIICIWSADTCESISQFKQARDTRAVKAISFNKDSEYIATAGSDNDHSVFVFDLKGTKLGEQRSGPDPILDLAWSPVANVFATADKRGVSFWTFEGGLSMKKGVFGGNKMTSMVSVNFGRDGRCFSGSIDGSVYVWNGNSCAKSVSITTGFVNSICVAEDKILAGGKDSIIVLDSNLAKTGNIAVGAQVRALDTDGTNILVGLRDGTILEVSSDGSNNNILMQSHSDGEAWGLAICPHTGLVVTSCDDNKIMTWDPQARKCVATAIINQVPGVKKKIGGASTLSVFPPNQQGRAVGISSKNGHVAVGVNNGEVHIYSDAKALELVKSFKHSAEWIEVIQYSPDASKLAVGSHDNNIYIYETEGYQLINTLKGHNSFITSLDWSVDSTKIQSNCGAYELLFFDVENGTRMPGGATALRDEQWNTFTNKLGWPVQGVFPPGTDGSHVNGVDRSKGKGVFATADDYGLVNLYRNPCLTGAKPKSYRGHSEHVVRVRFDDSDTRMYSIGGYDRTVMQWKVV